ncbi:MAG TPA: hypothetical protein VLI90_06415 [Tepidisphaeraceae bacterium]|nr:hypothetical protein [Tepidisphaeraceae bacterium]
MLAAAGLIVFFIFAGFDALTNLEADLAAALRPLFTMERDAAAAALAGDAWDEGFLLAGLPIGFLLGASFFDDVLATVTRRSFRARQTSDNCLN